MQDRTSNLRHTFLHLLTGNVLVCLLNGFNPRTYTKIHTPTVVQGAGVDGPLLWSFWYVAVFRNDFTFIGKPLILLTRWGIFYGWWRCWRPVTLPTMVAIAWPPSWIITRIGNQVKTARNGNLLSFIWNITRKKTFWMILATRYTFIVERS